MWKSTDFSQQTARTSMASTGTIEDLMSILDVDEERAKELVAKHGSVEEAIKQGDDAEDDEGDAPGEFTRANPHTVVRGVDVQGAGRRVYHPRGHRGAKSKVDKRLVLLWRPVPSFVRARSCVRSCARSQTWQRLQPETLPLPRLQAPEA
jgi:hypothetical protein